MSSPFAVWDGKITCRGHERPVCPRADRCDQLLDCRAAARPAGGCSTRWDLKTDAYRTIVSLSITSDPRWRGSACGCRRAQRVEQNLNIASLADVRGRTAALGLARDLFAVGQSAENNHPKFRHGRRQLLDQREAAAALQGEIQNDRIRGGFARLRQHFGSVGDLPDTMHVGLSVDELAHHITEIAMIFGDEDAYRLLFHHRVLSKYRSCVQESSRASNSAVFSCINPTSARDSTLSRTNGSVFEPRKLKRQWGNSTDSPSVKSMAEAFFSKKPCTRARMVLESPFRRRLIS